MGKLDLYEVVGIDGRQYVRKERLDELQQFFDGMCQAHASFVDKIHAAIVNRAKPDNNFDDCCSPNGFGLCQQHPACDHVVASLCESQVQATTATGKLQRLLAASRDALVVLEREHQERQDRIDQNGWNQTEKPPILTILRDAIANASV